MANTSTRHRLDPWLLVIIIAMTLFGIVMIYSASVVVARNIFDDGALFIKKQAFAAFVGIITLIIASSIDYRTWQKYAGGMLIVTFVLLVSVFFLSKGEINGAHRWISIAGQSFQPSELAKLTLIIYLSGWLTQRKDEMHSITQTFLPFLAIMAVVSFLMLKEPDFGTLAIMLAASAAVYFTAGMDWKQIILGVLVAIVAFTGIAMSSEYRRARVMTFLRPHEDTSNASYHVYNIGVAVGSGGAWGLGFGESRQKRGFLPEPQTDSIFAVISEELGSLRSVLVILAFAVLAWRGLRIASLVEDRFGQLMATGITVWFIFQAFMNLGAMLQVIPLVGVPLPFISYGGTNLVISMLAVGILLNISKHTAEWRYTMPSKASKPGRRVKRGQVVAR